MFRTTRIATAVEDRLAASTAPLHVRIGIEDVEYDVQDLSAHGFAITRPSPLAPDTRTHVSFRLAPGLSISLQATARTWQAASARQWFDFGEVDRDILRLLLMSTQTSIVH